jgi:hypothetical protein
VGDGVNATVGALLDIKVDGGKYRILQDSDGYLHIDRYGEHWMPKHRVDGIDCSKMIIGMASELEELREEVARLRRGEPPVDNC